MKKIYIVSLIFLGLIAGLTGCKEKEVPEVLPPELTLNGTSVEAEVAGGEYSISYTLTNPVEGVLPDVVSVAGWIQDFEVTADRISFDVLPNDAQESRSAEVVVTYAGVSPSPRFQVIQPGAAVPEIVLERTEIELPAVGGSGEVGYTVQNAIEGIDVNIECGDDWVKNLWAKDGKVTFALPENTASVPRTSEVILSYAGANASATFRISQAKAEENQPDPSVPEVSIEVNGMTFDMVFVEGDTFNMGATSEQAYDAWPQEYPVHEVTLSSYYIGKFEVTQGLWEAVTGKNPSSHKGNANYPVEQISREDAKTFVATLSELTGRTFTLPTEAQWEFAARGGRQRVFKVFSGSDEINEVAWYYDNSNMESHPVGKKAPNELGLYDMSGNVWEWCSDWYGSYTNDDAENPTGPESGEYVVIRGGCFNNSVGGCRVSFRSSDSGGSNFNIGLRVVMLP